MEMCCATRATATSDGVRGAVARLAEAAYTELDDNERPIVREVMLRLAGGEPDALVRRRVPLSEFEQMDSADRVVAKLSDARLLTISEDEVELSHEALLGEWPRYRSWLEEDRAGRRLHAHLMSSAREWEARGRDPGELYRGARLASALDWAGQHSDRLNALERGLHSVEPDRRRTPDPQATQRAARGRRIADNRGDSRRHRGRQAADCEQRSPYRARATARCAGGQPATARSAMLLAREAVRLDRSQQTEATLLATLQRDPAVIGTFAFPINVRLHRLCLARTVARSWSVSVTLNRC